MTVICEAQKPVGIAINPSMIPESDYQIASRILNASIRLALKNPENQRDFEEWKRQRAEILQSLLEGKGE